MVHYDAGGGALAGSTRQLAKRQMHELSIAMRVIEMVEQEVAAAGGGSVASVSLRIGVLAGVSEGALQFAFEQAREDTVMQAATLRITHLPVQVYCPSCQAVRELPRVPPLACPVCGRSTGDLRQGTELELDCIELTETIL